jgi:hypothetical protein
MIRFRIDDGFALHPVVIEAGNAAIGLWLRAGVWSAANNTNGLIPAPVALRLGSRQSCYRLIDVGMFEDKLEGFYIPGWADKPSGPGTVTRLTMCA